MLFVLFVSATAGKFKREDLARALLTLFVLDLVQCVQLVCRCNDIKRVFFCGGMASSPLVRSMITTEYVRRNFYMLTFGTVNTVVIFVEQMY